VPGQEKETVSRVIHTYFCKYGTVPSKTSIAHGPFSYLSSVFLYSPLHAKSPVPQSFSVYISPTQSSSYTKSCSTVLLRIYLPTQSSSCKKSCSTVLLRIYLPTQSSSCKKSCSTVLLLRRSLPTLSHRDCVILSTDLFTDLLHLFICFFLYTKTM
jgi:hypothetical protein